MNRVCNKKFIIIEKYDWIYYVVRIVYNNKREVVIFIFFQTRNSILILILISAMTFVKVFCSFDQLKQLKTNYFYDLYQLKLDLFVGNIP